MVQPDFFPGVHFPAVIVLRGESNDIRCNAAYSLVVRLFVPGLQLCGKQRKSMPGVRFFGTSRACKCVGPPVRERTCFLDAVVFGISCYGCLVGVCINAARKTAIA